MPSIDEEELANCRRPWSGESTAPSSATPRERVDYPCVIQGCNKRFRNASSLNKHCYVNHPRCPCCDTTYENWEELICHWRRNPAAPNVNALQTATPGGNIIFTFAASELDAEKQEDWLFEDQGRYEKGNEITTRKSVCLGCHEEFGAEVDRVLHWELQNCTKGEEQSLVEVTELYPESNEFTRRTQQTWFASYESGASQETIWRDLREYFCPHCGNYRTFSLNSIIGHAEFECTEVLLEYSVFGPYLHWLWVEIMYPV